MIQQGSRLKVADNTGAKIVECIKVLGGSKRRYARLGDPIIVSVKSAVPEASIKKKSVLRAVIVRQKQSYRRADNTYIKFDDNAVVMVSENKEPKGSRIFGPVARELREKGYQKIISLAKEVV